MRAFFPLAAISVGLEVLVAAAVLGSAQWLVLGAFSVACGTRDLLRLADIRLSRAAAYALDCLLLAAVFLVMCVFKPFASDAPHELD